MEFEDNAESMMESEAITLELESVSSVKSQRSQTDILTKELEQSTSKTVEKHSEISTPQLITSQSDTKIITDSETSAELELKLETTDIFSEPAELEKNKKQFKTSETELLSVNGEAEPMISESVNLPKKRGLDDELDPVLIRICSPGSCGSDIIHINKHEFSIGRQPLNDEVIPNVYISRKHCTINYDKNCDQWFVTNISSTDTLINGERIEKNQSKNIKADDILQLSLCENFKYRFTFKKIESLKHPRLESKDYSIDSVLTEQKSFVEYQENERKDLERQLNCKQEEQEKLKKQLDELLADKITSKDCHEELNSNIKDLQKKIEAGNKSELELQQKYKELLNKLEEERLKFEEKLAVEKLKWQEVITETKQEKEKLKETLEEKMQEYKEQLEKKQEEEWQHKITKLLDDEKSVQNKLQNEKQLLENKVKEMEEILKQKEESQKQLERTSKTMATAMTVNSPQIDLTKATPSIDLTKCIIVKLNKCKSINKLPVLETIDLTGGAVASTSAPKTASVNVSNCMQIRAPNTILTTNQFTKSEKNSEEHAVIDRVNHIMDEQLTCSICSELFVRAMTLNCTHTFCRYCIESWVKRRKECPNCRAVIVSMTRSLVIDSFIEKMIESFTPEQMQKRKELIEERKQNVPAILKKKVVKRR